MVVAILAGCNESGAPLPSRPFDMGFVAVPAQPVTSARWQEAFRLIGDNAEYVVHHAAPDWEAFASNADVERSAETTPNLDSADYATAMARQHGTRVLIAIDPLASDRRSILPEAGGSFADTRVRQAFRAYAVRLAGDYQPDDMAIGSEINIYTSSHPEDAANLLSLIRETISAVRKVSPGTRLTASFQFEALVGLADGTPQWKTLAALEPDLDAIGITTYPGPWFGNPAAIPDDYYRQLADHTAKPILITESGWPSSGIGSPASQQAYLDRLVGLTDGLDVRLWVWWFLHDWSGDGFDPVFRSMGLRTSGGLPKPAWETWRSIHASPRQ